MTEQDSEVKMTTYHLIFLTKIKFAGQQNKNGFTLIELLIVVAIIGIITSIGVPTFFQYKVNGYNSAALSDLKNAKTSFEAYYSDNHFYPN